MKNIMILGICRTGKTTFSKMIQKEFCNYQIIEVDTIISALQNTVKNVPIGFIHDQLKENKLPYFLNLLIQKNMQKNGKDLGFIINGDSLMPKDLMEHFDLKDTIVYYFVSPSLLVNQILENCRKYDDKEVWTSRWTDQQLLDHFEFYKKIEPIIIEDCKKYGFKCIDVSKNRDSIFEELLEEVREELKQ